MRSSSARARNICLSSASAMTLRLVLAWQMKRMRRGATTMRAARRRDGVWSPTRPRRSLPRARRSSAQRLGHDRADVLLGRDALGELGLALAAELRGVPGGLLAHLADAVPALHQPHRATADAEDLAVHVLRVVAGQPGDQRRDVARVEDVELALFDLLAHERGGRRR